MPEAMKEDWEDPVLALEKAGPERAAGVIMEIPMDKIIPPREDVRTWIPDEHIQSLAASIAAVGLLHEIIVVPRGEFYEIISGHCRYLACKRLGWQTIRAKVLDATETEIAFQRLHENMFRADLSPVEKAQALAEIKNRYHLSDEDIARWLGKSRAWVQRHLRVLTYPEDVKRALGDGLISFEVAWELSQITDDVARSNLLRHAITDGATRKLAKMWREDWERTMRAMQALKPEILPETMEEVRQEFLERAQVMAEAERQAWAEAHTIPKRKCDLCGEAFREDALVVLYACQDCLGVIQNAQASRTVQAG